MGIGKASAVGVCRRPCNHNHNATSLTRKSNRHGGCSEGNEKQSRLPLVLSGSRHGRFPESVRTFDAILTGYINLDLETHGRGLFRLSQLTTRLIGTVRSASCPECDGTPPHRAKDDQGGEHQIH
jgi:hypothetical protein